MPGTWSTSGLDLHLELAGPQVGRALERALREAIRDGRLAAGSRLPSSRALARDLGIARNTVVNVYRLLAAEGWLAARSGSATRVSEQVAGLPRPAPAAPRLEGPAFDLRPGQPDLSTFPRAAWLAAARSALTRTPMSALGYEDGAGRPELRTELAAYLARTRGVRTTPEQVIVCSGFAQGLALICRLVAATGGTRIALEQLGHQAHTRIAAAAGLRPHNLPVDGEGARIDRLDGSAAALLTPAHQFPLGVPLSAARRMAAVRWASATGGLLIEDDYDGEFRYDSRPIGALQALAPEQVVYAGTASKALAPGLRIGWLALPSGLVEPLLATRTESARCTSAIDQLVLAELMRTGAYDRHVRRARLAYRRRRQQLAGALAATDRRVGLAGVAAGLHVLVELPSGCERQVVDAAARRGVAVTGLAEFAAPGDDHPAALVIGFATPPEHAYAEAVRRVCAALGDAVPAP